MINLPFNKWTLVFKYDKFEIEFQDQQNKTRLLAFRIFCLSLTFASLMALIIFVIQQQPIQLLLTMTGAVIGCFWFFIISSKLEAYLKHIFSGVYIWTSSTHILLSLYGQQIPQFILGFHFSLLAFCVIQFSQNGLKVFYSIITPIIMLIVYEVYELMNMQYIFHSICCWCFASFFTYMFEYTSRLAFSLNKITNYQQTIINEYVNDPLLAVSLDKRTRQFNLEFKNKQLEETLNIESTNEMKQFLRSSYVINQSESLRKPCEKSSCHSSKLEEMLWKKFQSSEESIQQEDQNTFDISLISKQDEVEVEQQLKIQIKQMNFGKPILLIVIKYYEQPQIKDKYEQLLQYNNAQFIAFSQQLINSLIKLSKEIKKTKSNTRNQECIPTPLALNIQIINYARNLNMFYQIGKVFQQNNLNQQCLLNEFLTNLSLYFKAITLHNGQNYQIQNLLQKSYTINLNLKYLAQLLMNIFEGFIKILGFNETIILKVSEELTFNNQQYLKPKQNLKSIKNTDVQYLIDQRLVAFSFYILTKNRNIETILRFLKKQFDSNFQEESFDYDEINKEITFQLLNKLGPIDKIEYKVEDDLFGQINQQRIQIIIRVYSDQSQLEQSFFRFVKKAYCAQFKIQ